jgi:hypothetical protein
MPRRIRASARTAASGDCCGFTRRGGGEELRAHPDLLELTSAAAVGFADFARGFAAPMSVSCCPPCASDSSLNSKSLVCYGDGGEYRCHKPQASVSLRTFQNHPEGLRQLLDLTHGLTTPATIGLARSSGRGAGCESQPPILAGPSGHGRSPPCSAFHANSLAGFGILTSGHRRHLWPHAARRRTEEAMHTAPRRSTVLTMAGALDVEGLPQTFN